MLLRVYLIWTYAEGGHHEVKNFLVAFPNGASDQLLQLEESGLNAEQGGHGGNTDLGGLGGIEDQGENSRQELVAANCGDGLQSEDDVGAHGVRNGAALDVRNKTLNGRDQVGVTQSAQGNDHLGVGLCRFEGFIGHASVLVDGVGLAGTQFVATAGDANQMTESQSDGTSQFPIIYNSNI